MAEAKVAMAPVQRGDLIGSYRLHRYIARGAAGSVWVGTDAANDHRVAVKVLDPELTKDAQYTQRFLREARIVKSLQHPNIVNIHSLDLDDHRFAIIMELLEGPDLGTYLVAQAMAPLQAVNVSLQVLDALKEVHRAGVIHRDLKPQNIIVTGDPHSNLSAVPSIKLLDFGGCKDRRGVPLTQLGGVVGTPAYMAPEQVMGEEVSEATDVYAVGELLYEMLTQRPVFDGKLASNLLRKLDPIEPHITITKKIEARGAFEKLIRQCLATNPIDRPSIDRLVRDLSNLRDNVLTRQELPTVLSPSISNLPSRSTSGLESLDSETSATLPMPAPELLANEGFDTELAYWEDTTLLYGSKKPAEDVPPSKSPLLIPDSVTTVAVESYHPEAESLSISSPRTPTFVPAADGARHRSWPTSIITLLGIMTLGLGLMWGVKRCGAASPSAPVAQHQAATPGD